MAEDENGVVSPKKFECLVMAENYTDAEKTAYCIAEDLGVGNRIVDIEIMRTKITELVYNDTFAVDTKLTNGLFCYYLEEGEDSEVGIYQVSVVYHEDDEATGKTKDRNYSIYVPAESAIDVKKRLEEHMARVKDDRDYSIRNIKFDKADSVYVTKGTHQSNIKS